jgi:SET family sugar efflux transporter-like MFS transporter
MNMAAKASSSWTQLVQGLTVVISEPDYRTIYIFTGLNALLSAMMRPILPLWIVHGLKISSSSVFFVLSAIGAVGMVTNLMLGHVSDILKRRKSLIELGVVLVAVRGFLFATVPSLASAIIGSVLKVSTTGLGFAALRDKMVNRDDIEREGIVIATVRTSASFGYMVGPVVAISLVSLLSFRGFFYLYGAISLLALGYVHVYFQEKSPSQKTSALNDSQQHGSAIESGVFTVVVVAILVVLLLAGSNTSGSLLALYVDKKYSHWAVAAVFGVGPVFEMGVFPVVGMMNDRLGTQKMVLLGILGELIYFFALYFSRSLLALLVVQVFGTFYTAVLYSTLMTYVQNLFRHRAGFSSSLFFSLGSLSSVIGNLLIGSAVAQGSYRTGFLVLEGATIVALLIWFAYRYSVRRLGRASTM